MRRDRSLLAGSALSILISTTALAQAVDPAGAPRGAPPGYGQPPGYPQQPPPGSPQQQPGYPPPGYTQQPGYTPQTYMAPPPPAGKHGFLPVIYLGVNSFQDKAGENIGPGLRLGTILGGRITPEISINGELTIDIVNPSNLPAGTDVTVAAVDLALSPLYHVALGNAELVLGPKLGLMVTSASYTDGGQDAGSESDSGYVFGLNAGLFGNVSPTTALGVLVSFEGRKYPMACVTAPGQAEACTSSGLGDNDKVLGVSAAVMF